jgi:cell division transport system permease protein
MALITENFFKLRLINSKISILIATIFSVILIETLGILAFNYKAIEDLMKESVGFNLVLEQNTKELETQQLIKNIMKTPGVSDYNFIDKATAAQELTENIGEEFLVLLDQNPLNDVIEVYCKASYINTSNIANLKNRFLSHSEISEVLYDSELIYLIDSASMKIKLILGCASLFFCVIAYFLINSNIRLTIYSERFIIKTMQLVGATKIFIQLPFLKNSIKISLISIFLGNFILITSLYLLNDLVPEIITHIKENIMYLIAVTSAITILITLFSTWICVRKYLNLKTHELYK